MAVPAVHGRLDLVGDPGGWHVEMRRDCRAGVADRIVDLLLGEIARIFQARGAEIGACEPRSSEIRIVEQRTAQIGAGEVRAFSRASLRSPSDRSAPSSSALVSVAKRSEACLSRAKARLTGPPLMGPI